LLFEEGIVQSKLSAWGHKYSVKNKTKKLKPVW